MSDLEKILTQARSRASEINAAYAGAVSPAEARELMQQPGVKLVDVRSRAELDFVGRVPGSVEIEWKSYPGMRPNPEFLQQLSQQVPAGTRVLFLCRSGGRSHEAATAAQGAGYQAFNVLEGFEGDRDDGGHRNTVSGWRAAGLPWTQS